MARGTLLALLIGGCGAATAPGGPVNGDVHSLIVHELEEPLAEPYTSPVVTAPHAFNELLLSWNVATPAGAAGFRVDVRVGREDAWSPWLYVGQWGERVPDGAKTLAFEKGKIDVDYFRSPDAVYDRAQYRVRAAGAAVLHRFGLCFSDRAGGSAPPAPAPEPQGVWQRRLAVPFLSQRSEGTAIAGRICSPTSVAMVLGYRGVERPTAEVAARIYDREHDLYGNWPRAVQAAFTYGVPGYLARFNDWREVRRLIAAGQPLIISITATKGQLRGAPYEKTAGHLLVLTGFDEDGDVCVNDPAAREESKGRTTYRRRDLETVWMGKGGTAYVLQRRLRRRR